MSVLLHISDPHFGTEQAQVATALETLVRRQRPALAVLSGDVTQRATTAQFAAARAFIDRLGIPCWVTVPGNHDIPLFNLVARLFDPYGRYRAALGRELEPEADTPDWLVLSHNTTRWYRHANGQIDTAQVERTAARLAEAARRNPRQVRVVVVHQPVAVRRPEDDKDLLRGAAAAVARWAEAGADLVLGGHIHLPYILPLHARQPLARALWAVQAGTALSSRIRPGAPNSVNLLHAEGSGAQRACRVERWDYSAADAAFAVADEDRLALDPFPPAAGSAAATDGTR